MVKDLTADAGRALAQAQRCRVAASAPMLIVRGLLANFSPSTQT